MVAIFYLFPLGEAYGCYLLPLPPIRGKVGMGVDIRIKVIYIKVLKHNILFIPGNN